jgi:hypothetical protein
MGQSGKPKFVAQIFSLVTLACLQMSDSCGEEKKSLPVTLIIIISLLTNG